MLVAILPCYNQYQVVQNGPGFFRQNTSGYALGVLTPKASPSGWVFSQAQQPMIKTYKKLLPREDSCGLRTWGLLMYAY